MIEAMACGTPVIAYRSGSVPEVIDDGVTGFIVESEEEAVDAVNQLAQLDRRKVRERFEERFSAHRMARAYESHYRQLIDAATPGALRDDPEVAAGLLEKATDFKTPRGPINVLSLPDVESPT
jgi:glycogen synthase